MATKKAVVDPYMINVKAMNQLKNDMTMASSGIICPKRNRSIGKECKVCSYIGSQIWAKQYPKGHPAKDWAGKKMAKASFFLNVVFPDNKEKSKILEIGKDAGSDILDGVRTKGWTDIAHPKKGMGREMMITKGKNEGGYNAYSVSPDLKQADWDVKKSVLAERCNLSNIVSMLQNNELNDTNHIKSSSMKDGETLRFRVLPPWEAEDPNDETGLNRNFMAIVYRHWGVTQDQIDGKEGINWQDVELKIEEPEKQSTAQDTQNSTSVPEPEKIEKPANTDEPKCFGNASYYDAEDEDCSKDCPHFEACTAIING